MTRDPHKIRHEILALEIERDAVQERIDQLHAELWEIAREHKSCDTCLWFHGGKVCCGTSRWARCTDWNHLPEWEPQERSDDVKTQDVRLKAARLCKSAATRAKKAAHDYAKAVLRQDSQGVVAPNELSYALQLRDAADRLWNLTR